MAISDPSSGRATSTANYEETTAHQLCKSRAASHASRVDMFPSATVHGVVNSIAPASGEEFALLPYDLIRFANQYRRSCGSGPGVGRRLDTEVRWECDRAGGLPVDWSSSLIGFMGTNILITNASRHLLQGGIGTGWHQRRMGDHGLSDWRDHRHTAGGRLRRVSFRCVRYLIANTALFDAFPSPAVRQAACPE